MLRLITWSPEIDLSEFYLKSSQKGFVNNSSRKAMVDCFKDERQKQTWILFFHEKIVGSVAAHSLDIFEKESYRICARTCILTENLPKLSLRTLTGIKTHQNYTAQFLMPVCIDWCPPSSDLYITSNDSEFGSQKLVNDLFCPALESTGVLIFSGTFEYRSVKQNFWKVNVEKFYQQLLYYGRWSLDTGSQNFT